jgi:hypothetical protein
VLGIICPDTYMAVRLDGYLIRVLVTQIDTRILGKYLGRICVPICNSLTHTLSGWREPDAVRDAEEILPMTKLSCRR